MNTTENHLQPELIKILDNSRNSPALSNDFYTAWMQKPLEPFAVELFAANYLARTKHTSSMVALSLLSTDDVEAKTEISKNLFSELGHGNPQKSHINLLNTYLSDLLSRLHRREYSINELRKIQILPGTVEFTKEQRELYQPGPTPHDRCRVLGAHLTQEWIAYTMLTQLYEGARNYMHLYKNQDEFHEYCEYFHAHIGESEKSHREQALFAASRECQTESDRQAMLNSCLRFLDITAKFWEGLATAMRTHTI